MPKLLIYGALILIVVAMIPPAVVARMRAKNTAQRRIHFIQDMDNQAKFRAQHENPLFNDGRAMRPVVPGTIAHGELNEDDAYYRGYVQGENGANHWVTQFPAQLSVDLALIERGRDRFNIFCQPCHGLSGYGDGIVSQRGMSLIGTNGTNWVQAKSLHEQAIREQPLGQTFNSITEGVRTMSGYAAQIPVADRWAIVAYVKSLQRSQHAKPSDVSDPSELPLIKLPPQESSQ